jgi:4-aminobutyrate aminotransferase-like enzyme
MAVLDELEDGRILRNAVDRGEELRDRLTALREDVPLIWDVRGRGLMIGVELRDAESQPLLPQMMQELKRACQDAGLLLSISNTTVVLTPPLIISSQECEHLVSVLAACIRSIRPSDRADARSWRQAVTAGGS